MPAATLQAVMVGVIEMVPAIPPVAPSKAGLARGARYPPGETMNPATVDTVVRKRAAIIRALLIVIGMILPQVVYLSHDC